MPLLTDTDIDTILDSSVVWKDKDNTLHIYPFRDECLTPMGYDLCVGQRYVSAMHGGPINIKTGESIYIDPGDMLLIETLETVDLPQNKTISALIESKVTMVSRGFSHISTTVDADWQGKLIIALINHTHETLKLDYAEAFCTIVFLQNRSPASRPSGKPPNRPDIILAVLAEQARKKQTGERAKKRKEVLMIFIPVAVMVVFITIGYVFFRTGSGFAGAIAVGVALAESVFLALRSKYG